MIIVMPLAFCSIFAWSRQKKNDVVMALAKSLLWFELFVVLFANVCSIGHSLNKWTALLCWLFVIFLFTLLGGKMFPDGVRGYWKHLGRDWKMFLQKKIAALKRLGGCEKVLIAAGTALCLFLLFLALLTVPYNYDSMTYHLARIGHWIDNGSVNYYVTNIDRQLYSPVLSEYNMLFAMLLTECDVLLNLFQYLAMLLTAVFFYRIMRLLGTRRPFAIFGVFAFLTMPLTITQSITTQNDLSATLWLSVFVYLIMQFLQLENLQIGNLLKNSRQRNLLVCIGLSVGFGFLMKVSVCASMLMFMPWVLICCIRRKDKLTELLKAGGLAGLAMLFVIAETLIRTYQACGTFIANTTSGDIMVATKNVSYIIVNILKNYSLLITQHFWTALNGFVYRIAIRVGALLHVEVNNIAISFHGFDFVTYLNTGNDMYSHDRTSSAFAAYFALLAGILLVFCVIGLLLKHWKQKSKAQKEAADEQKLSYGFIVSAWLSFGFMMALLRWQPWGSRLLYPALAMMIPAGAHILDYVLRKNKKNGVIILLLSALSFVLCVAPIRYNMQVAESYLASGMTNRMNLYFTNNGRYDTYEQLKKVTEKLGATDIGVVISGDGYDYPLWKMFREEYPAARLRHILVDDTHMVAQGKQPQTPPDCILWIERGRLEVGDTLDFYGQTYICVFTAASEYAPDSVLIPYKVETGNTISTGIE